MSYSAEEKITFAKKMIADSVEKHTVARLSGLSIKVVEQIIAGDPITSILLKLHHPSYKAR